MNKANSNSWWKIALPLALLLAGAAFWWFQYGPGAEPHTEANDAAFDYPTF